MTDSILLAFVITLGAVLAPIFIWMIINVYQLIWIDIRSWWEWRKYRD